MYFSSSCTLRDADCYHQNEVRHRNRRCLRLRCGRAPGTRRNGGRLRRVGGPTGQTSKTWVSTWSSIYHFKHNYVFVERCAVIRYSLL